MSDTCITVTGLKTYFPHGGKWLGKQQWIKAVDDVDLKIKKGEVLGLVGESGSGKTTLGKSILRLVEPTEGAIEFYGESLMELNATRMRKLRHRMQIIHQDPYGTLNPRMQVKQIIAEPLSLHNIVPKHKIKEEVISLLAKVGMEEFFMHRYPHEFSGGQRQRIAIARALSMKPDFIVADEPVSALDVSVQAQIIELLIELQRNASITMLFISHDLAVVERIADRIAVMYQGKIVEEADTESLISNPQHPYTRSLLKAARTHEFISGR